MITDLQELIIASLSIAVGIYFCFYGYKNARLALTAWAGLSGYWLGTALVHVFRGTEIYSGGWSLVGALAGTFIFILASLSYYTLSVSIFYGTLAYWLTSGLLIWTDIIKGSWIFGISLVVALLFSFIAVYSYLAKWFVLAGTALGGTLMLVTGLLLMINNVQLNAFNNGLLVVISTQSWLWQSIWPVLAVFSYMSQSKDSFKLNLNWFKEWKV